LIAAPGTPKAVCTPSHRMTRTAASIAFILAISVPFFYRLVCCGQDHVFRLAFQQSFHDAETWYKNAWITDDCRIS
jgi:hypothetical protein